MTDIKCSLTKARELMAEWGSDGVSNVDLARALDAARAEGAKAEREACAQQLNDRGEQWRTANTVTANTMARIWDDEATAIRSRP